MAQASVSTSNWMTWLHLPYILLVKYPISIIMITFSLKYFIFHSIHINTCLFIYVGSNKSVLSKCLKYKPLHCMVLRMHNAQSYFQRKNICLCGQQTAQLQNYCPYAPLSTHKTLRTHTGDYSSQQYTCNNAFEVGLKTLSICIIISTQYNYFAWYCKGESWLKTSGYYMHALK